MLRRKLIALAALVALAQPVWADEGQVVATYRRARDLSELLLAADGKLVEKQPIQALHASVLAGHGSWKDLDARALALAVRALSSERDIPLAVEPNATARATGDCCGAEAPTDPEGVRRHAERLAWPRRALGLDAKGRADDARGTLVAVLDTGVDEEHPLLAGVLVPGESLVDAERDTTDRNGHGTAMVGLLVARGEGPLAPRGIAPGARVLAIKVLDARGSGDLATLARGIVRAADRNARVILVSAGLAAPSALLEEAVRYARSRGAIVVAAAGNEPLGRALSPAATPGAVGVTATAERGKLALACALDPSIELAAPGREVLTVLPRSIQGGAGLVSGTSASAALTAGVAALAFGRGATPDEVLRVLRGARRPLLAGQERFFSVGELDAALALERLASSDVALEAAWAIPAVAKPGAKVTLHARVRAVGGKLAAGLPADGSAAIIETSMTVPEDGRLVFTFGGASRVVSVPRGTNAPRIVIASLRLESETSLLATVVNEGDAAARALVVRADAEGLELAPRTLETLEAGARAEVRFALPEMTRELVRFSVSALDTRGWLDARLAGADPRPVKPQYQQSDSVDLIADAPWRLEPTRTHVPVLVFIPSKGDGGRAVDLAIDTALIRAFDSPAATSGTTLYKYETGVTVASDPSRFAPGTELLDEDGAPLGTLNIFKDQLLTDNGRHEIFRFPRAAFGVAATPAQTVRKYVEVRLHYKAHRKTAQGAIVLEQGDYRKMLEVVFSAKKLPTFGTDGRYFDTHVHTIAEWYFNAAPGFDPLAPRKSYGGPLVMLREAAFALGFTDAVLAKKGSIITTDHACFNNTQDPDATNGLRRPQVGPSAPKNSLDAQGKVKDQHSRYREIFGITANEEIAVDQLQKLMGLPVPWGAHMLAFRTGHWESRWNAIDGGTSTNIRPFGRGRLALTEVLSTLAQLAPNENKDAFLYTAHGLTGSLPWDQKNLEEGFELTPAANGTRDGKWVNSVSGRFVLKGHQLWNKRAARDLPSSKIDWKDLNPWVDTEWKKGNEGWTHGLEESLLKYHAQVSALLRFERASEPGRVFPRKLYIAAGSDAHGDFNYEENRTATFLNLPSTFTVVDNAYGKARVYVFEDGHAGAADGERSLNALSYGSTCLTDGPLASFAFDADGRFDSTKLAYHARAARFEDEDGKVGGAGAGPDGGRTALVLARSTDALYGYRYEDAPETAVTSIELFRDEQGVKTPTRRLHDPDKNADYDAAAPLASLPLGGTGQRNVAPAHPVTALSAIQLGVFAGAKPGLGAGDTGRCYTNPIWVAPVTAEFLAVAPDVAKGTIPAGALRVRFTFPMSMEKRPLKVEVKALDQSGDSTDGATPGVALAQGAWSAANGVEDSVLELTNAAEISLAQPYFPHAGRATFVVYFREAPRDSFGNELNRLAATFETQSTGTSARPGGRTSPGATTRPSTPFAGGGGGGGGCAIVTGAGESGEALLPLAALLVLAVAFRRRGATA